MTKRPRAIDLRGVLMQTFGLLVHEYTHVEDRKSTRLNSSHWE